MVDGLKRTLMELVTSEKHAIGYYKRCAYEYEAMDAALTKLRALGPDSKLNHSKLQLLKSYTKHYDMSTTDFAMIIKFRFEQLEKDFESSKNMDGRTGKWKDNLKLWSTENPPLLPAVVEKDFKIYKT